MVGNQVHGGGKLPGALLGSQEAPEAQNRGFGVSPGGWGPPGPPCRPALFSRFGILTYRPDRAMLLGKPREYVYGPPGTLPEASRGPRRFDQESKIGRTFYGAEQN